MIYTLCGAVPFIGAAMAGTEPKGVDVEINAPRDCGPDGHFLARPGDLHCQCGRAPDRAVPAGQRPEPTDPWSVALKAMAAAERATDVTEAARLAAFAAAPFIAAAAASRPPLDECAEQTRNLMAGEPRAASLPVDDSSPRSPEPGPNEGEQLPTLDTLPITRTYRCVNTACVHHGQPITVQLPRFGHFVDMLELRCVPCGCEPIGSAE